MPGDDLKLKLRLTADSKGFVGEVRVAKRELDKLTGGQDKASASARKLTGSTDRAGRSNTKYARTARRGEAATRGFGRSFFEAHGHALKYIGSIGGITLATRGLVRHADSYTQISNAVRLATDAGASHAAIQQEIFDIAHRTRAPVQELADLFQKLTISSADLGASNEQFLRVLEGVGQALVINGTSAQQARGALLQFSQAMSSNVVRAEEFNSILEGAKPILIAVANNLDAAGGSVGRLRKLVIEGQVSSREFFEAFERGLPELAESFERANSTLGQGLIQVDNAMTRLIGRMDQVSGASSAVAGALETVAGALAEVDADALADGLDSVAIIVGTVAGLMLGRGLLGLTAYGLQAAKTTVATQGLAVWNTRMRARIDVGRFALRRGAVAARRYGGAVAAASIALRGFSRLLSLAAGPAGWAALAAYTIYELAAASSESAKAARQAGDVMERYQQILAGVREEAVATGSALTGALGALESEREVRVSVNVETQAEKALAQAQAEFDSALAGFNEAGRPGVVEEGVYTVQLRETPFGTRTQEDFDEIRRGYEGAERNLIDAAKALEVAQHQASLAVARARESRLRDQPRPYDPAPAPRTAAPSAADTAFRNLVRQNQTARERIEADYERSLEIIKAADHATEEEITEQRKRSLAARNQAIHALYVAGQNEIERERAAAEQRRQAEEDEANERLRASGIPALERFRERQKELAGVTDLSAVALANQSAKTRIAREVGEEYEGATEQVKNAIIASRLAIEQQEAALGRQAEAYQRITGNAAAYAQQLMDLHAAEQLALTNAAGSSNKPGEIGAEQEDIRAAAERERRRIHAEQYLEDKRSVWEEELLMAQGYQSRVEEAEDQHQKNILAAKLAGQPALSAIAQKHSKTILALDRDEEASAKQKFTLGLDLAQETFGQLAAHSKKAFKLNQLASIAQAVINTYEGATKALSAYPPPFNFIAMAATVAAGFAQVAAIRAQQPPQGYALGGIVDSPTFFTARNVPSGVAGEAGPEAILPLRRAPNGRLGVDGGAGRRPVVIHITIGDVNVRAADGEQPQAVGQAVTAQVLAVLQPAVQQVIVDEQRPGGLLNRTDKA